MKTLGIKYQLRLTTLIPVFLIALLFAVFYNGQFSKDLKHHMLRLGQAYIRQLMPAAQFAMMRNDNRTLQGLINASTVNPEVKAIAFYNAEGRLQAYHGGKHSLHQPFKPPEFTGDYIETKVIDSYTINFLAPITIPTFNLYSTTDFKKTSLKRPLHADDILGWLSIDIDTQSMLITQYQMFIMTIIITLLGLLSSLTIHYIFSRRIYIPISRLRRSMKQILSNEFETQIKTTTPGELGIIERGCAHLQKQYLTHLRDLSTHIEVATADLQQNLVALEEKNIELSLEKKKIEEKSRQKSEFIANMSHEIRTPMNGVIGFTNVLLESKLDCLQMDYVKTIKSSAHALLNIINDILDYSKMDAGKLHLDCIPLDIRACIDEVLALTAPSAHKKGIDLLPTTEINVPKKVLGDPLRLKQIITNLISNAIKFTNHGYVLIRTSIEEETENSYSFCLAVSDTGIGIPADDQTKLFNAFNQADTTITRRFGGSGLGLVICKKLTEAMQGHISLVSEVNKGSTFSIHITLEKLAAYEIEKDQSQCYDGLKVLCFDDNPLYLETMCNGLGYWGIESVRITSFNQLATAFREHSDCSLAFINVNEGCEKKVAQVLRQQSIPCVVVSKWAVQDPQALGADAFLFKPISIQKLREIIETLLNQASQDFSTNQALENLRTELRALKPEILIAEDNPVNRLLLNSLLSKYATIETVNNGEEAVKACQSKRYQVILLDLQMPKLNGLEAASLIHHRCMLNKDTPIVVISADNQSLNNEQLQKTGVNFCLQKPIDEGELLNYLLKILKKSKSHAIDWQLCVQKVSGNQELAEDLLLRFVKELEINREEFIQLMHDKALKAIENAAHKLHGACCFCGVPYLQTAVIRLEKQAKTGFDNEELKQIFAEFIQRIDEVINEFDKLYAPSSN